MWSMPGGIGSPTSTGAGYGTSKAESSTAEPCRFFLNGGCLRGDACPYSHEFPDDRHLDVNNVGFIFTSGVQNSATALQRRYNQQAGASSVSSPQPAAPSSAQAVQQPPAYHHGARTHQSPQPQPTLSRGGTVGGVSAQPFIPQSFSQQTPIPTSASQQVQYSAVPAGPTSSIYTYGSVGQQVSIISPHAGTSSSISAPHVIAPQGGVFAPAQAAMHVSHAAANQPQYAPQAYIAAGALQPSVALLQPPLRGSPIGAVPIAPRTDPGPYAPPPALPYALPPTMTIAYQYVGIPAGVSEVGYGAYSQQTQQAALMATLIPVAATSA